MGEQVVNADLSRGLAEWITMRPGECFYNAHKAAEKMPGAFYVEGWAVTQAAGLTDHGWIEVEGEIVDPSWAASGFGKYYAAAERFSRDSFLRAWTENAGELPLMWRHGWGGGELGAQALRAARAYLERGEHDR